MSLVRFGSFAGTLNCSPRHLEALQAVFGVGLYPLQPSPERPDFALTIVDAPDRSPVPASGANRLRLGGSERQPTITTDALRVTIADDEVPCRVRIEVIDPELELPPLIVHFVFVVHKLLFLLQRVVLHAGAVSRNGQTTLFVGEKGAGKSTLCLSLARAGGTVLGEDNVVLRRANGRFLVSGGDDRARVTERTERHFFPAPLPVPARDFAGTPKKELRRSDFIPSRPFEDVVAHRLVFPRVTGQCQLRPLKAQTALLRLIAANSHFQRFAGAADQIRFFGLLADFVATVSCWELDLSHDLHELDRFVTTLDA